LYSDRRCTLNSRVTKPGFKSEREKSYDLSQRGGRTDPVIGRSTPRIDGTRLSKTISQPATEDSLELHFDDHRFFTDVLGQHDAHVHVIEQALGVRIGVNGSTLRISGAHPDQALAGKVLSELYEIVKQGHPIYPSDVEYSVRILRADGNVDLKDIFLDTIYISAHKRVIAPKSVNQKRYIDAIRSHDIVFGIGPAGTGKTYLAMAMGVDALRKEQVKRIILTRPAVEAGEALGFLPGDLQEKIFPYLRPLYDALYDMLEAEEIQKYMDRGVIEIAPLAYMRGRTLNHAFVILDEAQNTTTEQMFMFLTRLGSDSKCVVTGDHTQIDLPANKTSGLVEAMYALDSIPGIQFTRFTERDVVRHPLVQSIIRAYKIYRDPKGEK
jgi:phosphate starvation-inducible protein PhoH and related proteins